MIPARMGRLGVFLGSVLFVAACSVPGSSGPASTLTGAAPSSSPGGPDRTETPASDDSEALDIPLDPLTPPPELPGECLGHGMVEDGVPPTVEVATRRADAVVEVTVLDVGEAQWNTKDGRLPTGEVEYLDPSNVLRLLRVRVDRTQAGSMPTETATVYVLGGTIGCHRFIVAGLADPVPGKRFLMFLGASRSRFAAVRQVQELWPIEDGAVITPVDGRVPVDEVRRRVEAVAP